jgi:hypothetical protein
LAGAVVLTEVCEAVQLELRERLILVAVVVLVEPPRGLDLKEYALAALQILRRAVVDETPVQGSTQHGLSKGRLRRSLLPTR